MARRERPVRVAVVTIGMMGVLTGASSISAAFELDANGVSSAGIGLLLSAGAVVWIVVAQLAGRLPERRLAPPVVAAGLFVLAATWLVPALAPTTAAIALFLLLTSACRASLNTFVYRLGRPRDGKGYGGVLGLMNVVYASCGHARAGGRRRPGDGRGGAGAVRRRRGARARDRGLGAAGLAASSSAGLVLLQRCEGWRRSLKKPPVPVEADACRVVSQ